MIEHSNDDSDPRPKTFAAWKTQFVYVMIVKYPNFVE